MRGWTVWRTAWG